MTTPLDYYSVLEISETAGSEEIRKSYRKLAFLYHPDHNDDPGAADKMKQLNEAYAVLSDETKKANYDSMRSKFGESAYTHFRSSYTENDIFSGSDINKIFEELAKDFGFRGFDDLFREFYGTGYKAFNFKKNGFSIKGVVFSLPDLFKMSPSERTVSQADSFPGPGQMLGSVFKKLSFSNSAKDGKDILDTIMLSKDLAFNGGPYPYFVKSRNSNLMVKIPAGVREGQKIRLAKMGKSGRNGGNPGDLYLKVTIEKTLFEKVKHGFSSLKNRFSYR
jgi:curved DNA-binding protein